MTAVINEAPRRLQDSSALSVVLFDLDDTLFAHRNAVDIAIVRYRAILGGPFAEGDDAAAVSRWYQLEESQYHRYLAGELSFAGQRRERATLFAKEYGVELEADDADAWFDAYFREYVKAWMLHGDALACLHTLTSSGVRLGIVTNGDLDFQTEKIARLGLAPLFEHIITSGELGYAKPDARIFEHACRLFGVEPSRAAYVGDRLRTDAVGAAGAGLTGLWLDRRGTASPTQLMAARASGVPIIRTLAELPAAIGVYT